LNGNGLRVPERLQKEQTPGPARDGDASGRGFRRVNTTAKVSPGATAAGLTLNVGGRNWSGSSGPSQLYAVSTIIGMNTASARVMTDVVRSTASCPVATFVDDTLRENLKVTRGAT
jgi:hypothetical protein